MYDVGEVDDTPYFVMSYADRGSLADVMRSGRLPAYAELADLVRQAAKGLAVLHALGIVHRDIKPENLLFTSTVHGGQRLMVADLGVAKNVTGAAAGTWIGTPAYMAPEQRDTQTSPDPRADVHGLGAVAYALLAGSPPQPRHVADQSVPGPGSVRPVPPEIEQVVMRALEYRREDRWPDVTSFADALSAAARAADDRGLRPVGSFDEGLTRERGTATARAGTVPERAQPVRPPRWRSRGVLVGVGVLAVATVVAAGGYLIVRDPDESDERTAELNSSPSTETDSATPTSPLPSESPVPPPSQPAEAPRTKHWVDTFAEADVYAEPSRAGGATGRLYAGTVYVYCKSAGERVEADGQYNHWWLLTDPDEGPAEQWVAAYYLKRWGNDEAKTNSGEVIPDC